MDAGGDTGDEKVCAIAVVDAFLMYFWAFNWGKVVLGNQLGDHVGDWEHNLVRFENGVPTAVWYLHHASGEAFAFETTRKDAGGKRPLVYAANSSHVLYATPSSR
jgi:hypothetical protein